MRLVLDTHAIIWSLMDDPRLGKEARRHIEAARREDLCVSDMSLLEIAMLLDRGCIEITIDAVAFLDRVAATFIVRPISARIASGAISLDLPNGDPFDRVIAATSLDDDALLLTRDRALTDCPAVRTAW